MHELTRTQLVSPGVLRLSFADGITGDVTLPELLSEGTFEVGDQAVIFSDGSGIGLDLLYHAAAMHPVAARRPWWRRYG